MNFVDIGAYDVEPDIFSYNFPGHGGKFLFNQKNSFAPVLIPYAPVSISKVATPSNLSLGITDEAGINYRFDSTEWTSTGGGISTSCTSAWLLSDMISANKQDTIHFRYLTRSGSGITDSYFSDFLVLSDNCTGTYNGAGCTTTGQFNTDFGSVSTWWKQMTQIDFKNGKVVFESGPETREDFSSQFKLQNRLNAIRIYSYDAVNKNYSLIRSIYFFHSYFISGTDAATKRLKLDSIQLNTGTGSAVQTYRFTYNTAVALPSNASRMKDYWGYFNNINNLDPSGQPTTIAKMQVQYAVPNYPPLTIWIGGNHTNARDPDPNYMQAYILQKITFPTGGNTQFTYETNQYLDQGIPKYAGGLRIKTIKNYTDNTATPIVKTYSYGISESGYGRNNFLLEDHFFTSVQNLTAATTMNQAGQCSGPPNGNQKTTRTFFANPTVDLEGYDGAPVVYPFVTEYIGDGTTNVGKTTYAFADKTDAKTTMIGYGKPILTSYHFVRGQLINRSDYRRNINNSYSIVAENRKKYQFFPFQNTTGGIALGVFKSKIFEGYSGLFWSTLCETGTDSYSYLYNNYEIVSGDNKLVADTSIVYDQKDPTKYLSTITNYTYDDLTHLSLLQTQTVNSKNETITTAYTYPYNYGTTPYTNMTSSHIFDKVVQETITNSVSGQLSQKINNYSSFAGNNYLPGNIQLKIKTNPLETRASFNQYDVRGSVLEMQKINDSKQSIIWDYQGLQPVAELINAGQSDIAYTSFESDGKGNWTFTGSSNPDPTSPTGKRCYTLGSSITRSALSTTTTYIVSYWKKSGTVSVNSTTAVAGRTVNGWTYYEHKVINPTGGLVTVSGTNGVIDEVRLYPAINAQMTTYTYAPLIGVTSQCDGNNRITYYEYDRFNRLMLIRDQDKNILKQIYYNYSGQVENASIFYNSIQSGVYNKSGCLNCLTGSAVTYTVPASTYSAPTQAEANQLAIDDVVANGQGYADANGSCVTPSNATVKGSNANNQTHSFYFHNNCSGVNTNFSLSANQALTTLGTVPVGNYYVTFNPPAGQASYTYKIGSLTLRANSGTIYNVTVDTGGVIVNITP